MRLTPALRCAALVWITCFVPQALAAQHAHDDPRRVALSPRWEGRVDATAANQPGVHIGAGMNVRAGWYSRLGATLGAGAERGADDAWRASLRADATVRFLLDPFNERRRGLYGGAGLSVRALDEGGSLDIKRPVLVLVAGIEGPPRAGRAWAGEVALGGGVRVGVVVRRARPDRTR